VPTATDFAGVVFGLVFFHCLDVFFKAWGVIVLLGFSFDASDFVCR
jgi:hypothetical protein